MILFSVRDAEGKLAADLIQGACEARSKWGIPHKDNGKVMPNGTKARHLRMFFRSAVDAQDTNPSNLVSICG